MKEGRARISRTLGWNLPQCRLHGFCFAGEFPLFAEADAKGRRGGFRFVDDCVSADLATG